MKWNRILVIPLLIAVVGVWLLWPVSKAEAAPFWYSTDWGFRKKLVIDHTKVSGGSNLTNFPILVNISGDQQLIAQAQSSGNDIMFTDSTGTKLDHEIESYTNGNLIAWVRIPTLSASTDTTIFMYYGNRFAPSQQNKTGVWNTNYKGVWHLGESSSRQDSSSNNNNLTSHGSPAQTTGYVDKATDFELGTTDYLDLSDGTQTGLDITGQMTIEGWIKAETASATQAIASKDDTTHNSPYVLEYTSGNRISFLLDGTDDVVTTLNGDTTTLTSAVWYHVAGVYDGTNMYIYLNGVSDGSAAFVKTVRNGNDAFSIGSIAGGTTFDGVIDELRISNTGRSAGWIATEYNNQSSPSTFFTSVGKEEKSWEPVLVWKMDEGYGTTVDDSSIQANHGTMGAGSSAPTWIAEDLCMNGKCLFFDGTNDYISKTYSSDTELDVGSDSFAVSAWFKHPNAIAGTDVLIARSNNNATTGVGYKVYMKSTGVMCFGIDDDSSWGPDYEACSTDTFNDSKWHHVEGIKNSTTSITLFVDGKQLSQVSPITNATGDLSGSSANFYVGSDGDGASNVWDGYIDEVKVYTAALQTTANAQANAVLQAGNNRGSSASFGPQDNSFLNEGLVGYWKMDENTGTTTSDSSGNNYTTSTFTGNTTWTTGKFGTSLTFDGTDDVARIAVTAGSALDIGATSTSYSVSAWFNTTTLPGSENAILAKNASGGYPIYLFLQSGGQLSFKIYDGASTTATASNSQALNDGVWHHAVGVRDILTHTIKLYVDGNLAQTTADTITTSLVNTDDISIGNGKTSYVSSDFKGKIDEVRIYNRALSSVEVRSLYNFAPGPLGYWKLDENNGISSTNDSSGNGFNGTFMATNSNSNWVPGKFGSGYRFNGVDNYIDVTDNNSLDLTTQVTLSAWINGSGYTIGSDHGIARKDAAYTLKVANNGKVKGIGDTCTGVTGNTVLSNNTWYYVTWTYDGTTNKVYVNGVLDNSSTETCTFTVQSTTFQIGKETAYFNGIIDDVKLYNYPRTPAQIIQDMNGDHPIAGSPVGSQVGYWKFDEGYGTTAHDTSLNTNDITLSSARWTKNGKFNMAFDGSSSFYASRADDADFDFLATEDFTVSAWIKSDANAAPSAVEYMVNKSSATAAGYGIYGTTSGKVVFAIDDDATWTPDDLATSTTNVYDNAWHYVAARKTGTSKIDLFVDGKLEASDTSLGANGSLTNSVALYIGSRDGSANFYNGDVDEVKIYRAALTDDQILIDYNRGASAVMGSSSTASNGITADSSGSREYCIPGDTSTCSAPVGEWKMDENTGTTAQDTSGNGNGGTVTGGARWSTAGCKSGSCIQTFNNNSNTQDGISIADPASGILDFLNTQDFTSEVWMKSSASESDVVPLWKGGQTAGVKGYDMEISSSDNLARCGYADGTVRDKPLGTSSIFNDGKWHFIACVMDRSGTATGTVGYHIFVDGRLEGSDTALGATGTSANSTALFVGEGIDNGFEYTGQVDTARIYNYARNSSQIAWDYNRAGPVAWYKLDDCTGTTAYNSVLNANGQAAGNNGTISIGANPTNTSAGTCSSGTSTEGWNNGTTGKFNASLDFDGSDDFITTAAFAPLAGTGGTVPSVTWGGWFYPKTTAVSKTLIEKASEVRLTTDSNSKPICDIYTAGAFTSNTASATNTALTLSGWNHLVCTYDRTTIKLYLNGKQIDSWAQSGKILGASSILYIAENSSAAQRYKGQIDDVRIYNYALTINQILNLYNNDSTIRFGP